MQQLQSNSHKVTQLEKVRFDTSQPQLSQVSVNHSRVHSLNLRLHPHVPLEEKALNLE
jgi:hypothetical protein